MHHTDCLTLWLLVSIWPKEGAGVRNEHAMGKVGKYFTLLGLVVSPVGTGFHSVHSCFPEAPLLYLSSFLASETLTAPLVLQV